MKYYLTNLAVYEMKADEALIEGNTAKYNAAVATLNKAKRYAFKVGNTYMVYADKEDNFKSK